MIAAVDLERRLYDVVRKHFKNAPALERSTRFRDDLGADSLDLVELMFALEQEFAVEIPDGCVAGIRTLGDAVAFLEQAAA